MTELVYNFGPGNALIGVLHPPNVNYSGPPRPGILMANVGILHRVGPFRLYVDLARELARLGFPVLRFDHSGLGDSGAVRDSRTNRERLVPEMQMAMDLLTRRTGAATFNLVGLCSGADAAHCVAVADPRVKAVVFLDGYAYKTWGYYFYRYTRPYLSLQRWVSFFARRKFDLSRPKGTAGASVLQIHVQIPPRQEAQADIQRLVDRGTRLLYLYTGGIEYAYSHAQQFWKMYPGLKGGNSITTDLWPDVDHTFTMHRHRQQLISYVCQWLTSK